MEQNRNFKGIERYESLLKTICDQKNDYQFEEEIFTEEKEWKECLEEKEWEGCLGIACVLSVIEGINPSLPSLSKHLGIFNNKNLQMAFERLKINGVFGNRLNVKKDPLLNGNGVNIGWHTAAERERNAWCNIAGIAGGFAGVVDEIKNES